MGSRVGGCSTVTLLKKYEKEHIASDTSQHSTRAAEREVTAPEEVALFHTEAGLFIGRQ